MNEVITMEKKYKFYQFYVDEKNRQVIAVTHYAGRTIRATAKCHPDDIFDLEMGKKVAVAKAEIKVAKAKKRSAVVSYLDAAVIADAAHAHFNDMKQYYMDAIDQLDDAVEALANLVKQGE